MKSLGSSVSLHKMPAQLDRSSCAFITKSQVKVSVGNSTSNAHFKARNLHCDPFA